jgi:hypothetical protein
MLDDPELQPAEGQDGPNETLLSAEDPSESPAGDEPGETPKADDAQWSADRKRGYTEGTTKRADELKAARSQAENLAMERESMRDQIEFYKQQAQRAAAPVADALPEGVTEEIIRTRTDPLLKHSPMIKAMREEIDQLKGHLRDAVTARPESLVDDGDIPTDIVMKIAPQLRKIAKEQGITDPRVLRLAAKDLAAPVMAAELKRMREADTKRQQQKAAALKAAQPSASGGVASGGAAKDVAEMSQDELLAMFTGINGV